MSVSTIGLHGGVYQASDANTIGTRSCTTAAQNTDLLGVSNATKGMANSTFSFTMPAPTMDAASIMLALSSIQKKNTDEAMVSMNTAIEGQRSEIKKLNEQRAKEIETYFENLAKAAQPKKAGLFGFIAKFFKTIITAIKEPSKAKEAFTELGKLGLNSLSNIVKDLLTIAAIVGSAVIAVGSLGTASPLLAGVIIGLATVSCVATTASTIMSDPTIISMALEGKSDDEKASIMKKLSIASFVCLGVGLLSSIATTFIGNPAGAANTIAKLKVTVATLQAVSAVQTGAITVENAVDTKKVTDAKAKALDYAASADKTLAAIAEIEKELEIKIEVLKELLAAQQKMVESTANMLMNACEGNKTAATV